LQADEKTQVLMRRSGDWALLQVDANMAEGNSGGPVVNQYGESEGRT
jgi:S1-C subfamily serine protease